MLQVDSEEEKAVAGGGVLVYLLDSELFDLKIVRALGTYSRTRSKRALKVRAKLMLVVCLAAACQGRPDDAVVATVGRERLTLRDIESRIPFQLAEKITIQEKRHRAQRWVEDELLYLEAKKQRLDADPDVADRIAAAARDILVAELLDRECSKETEVFNGEIEDYYETHRDEFLREHPEIRARHILVRSPSDQERVKKALANEQLFDQVAREWSVDASAETGGDLGYFTPEMVDLSFWEACVKAKPGRQVPTSTPLGHHIIQVLDKREGGSVKDLMEVREEIRQRILSDRRQARQEALLEKLRGETSWSLDPEVLQKTAAR